MLLGLQKCTNTVGKIPLFIYLFIYLVWVCACMHMCVYVTVLMWRSKDNFWDSFFFLFTVWSPGIEIRFYSVLVGKTLPDELSCWPKILFLR